MAMNEKVQNAFNEQINKEMFSAYLYMSMVAWFENEDLPGLATWMRVQSQEELCHATILFNHVCERGGRVILEALEKPASEFKSPEDIFTQALAHEEFISKSINDLMSLAEAEKDFAARQHLEWFVEEQVEEEASATAMLVRAKRVGDNGQGLIMFDKEAGTRVFTLPGPLAAGE